MLKRLLLFALLIGTPSQARALPVFSTSTITVTPASVREGDVVTFTVTLRNSGDEGAPFAEVLVELPLEGMFVDIAGVDASSLDVPARLVEATLDLPAGAERQFTVRMVLPRDSGGNTLYAPLRVRYLYRGVDFSTQQSLQIESRPSVGGIVIGGIRLNAASAVLLLVLALYPVLRLLTRSRAPGHGPVIAMVIAVGFWSLFAAMAYDDWRTVNEFRETTCTVLDTRMRSETETSRVARSRHMTAGTTTSYQPLLALRYQTDRGEVVSTGYDTDSRLSIGGASRAAAEYAQWTIGASVKCWFDPLDVQRVVVIPGFGGAYFFALLPLPLFAYGIWGMSGRER